jgi:hypothetical protein
MDLDVESLGSGENRKKLMIGGALLAVIVIILLAATQLTPRTMTSYFSTNPVAPTQQTKLTVSLHNLNNYDLANVVVKVTPESSAITVTPSSKTEGVIGASAYRNIEFDVLAQAGTTPGSYRLQIDADMGGKPEMLNAFLEIKK